MRIAICSDYFYPKIGGITTHIEQLAKCMEKRGHEVIIVTKKADYDDEVHGLNVVRINSIFRTSKTIDIPNTKELKNALESVKPDIIHAHHAFSPISLLALSIGKKMGIKTVLTNHSIQFLYDFDYLWRPSSYILFPYREYIKNADKIIAVSNAAAEFISHFTDKKIHIIPNGIDIANFSVKRKVFDGKSVLFVGRFVYRKGIHILLEAMSHVLKKQDAKLTLVGSGYLKHIIKLFVRAFNLGKNVKIMENIPKEELIKIYRKAHVFVMPSIYGESFGIVLLEAMATKTPIVAYNQGGIGEIIESGVTGILVKKESVEEMAKNILLLLNNKDLARKIASNAFKAVKRYDWNVIAEEIENVYEG
ncbi:MAG TPA: glycosyltransferase family 1 protein [Candidatus Aenigmarchaeota archaeon]|nr:MAG: hypothetical protein DRP03_00265 [Candidatus Aenigmarchaeota archaeon]HDD45920.1 glycosyltransferase family 1 protein [Candidatus Aenigmarchaeota archaeon]